MARPHSLTPQPLIVDGDMSDSITSTGTDFFNADRVGYEIIWTGNPVGSFTVEVSHTGRTWTTLTLSEEITAAGTDDHAFIDIESAAKYIRLKYTRDSGTGTLNAFVCSKSLAGGK